MLKKFTKNEKGQAMVEFALITPLLILLLCGIIDFGWIFGNQLILNNAGRDTARQMAINYDKTKPDIDPTTLTSSNDITAQGIFTSHLGIGSTLNNSKLKINSTLSGTGDNMKVQITASYPLPFLTPLVSSFLRKTTIDITTDTTMRLE